MPEALNRCLKQGMIFYVFYVFYAWWYILAGNMVANNSVMVTHDLVVLVDCRHDWFYYTSTKCAIPDDMAGQQRF